MYNHSNYWNVYYDESNDHWFLHGQKTETVSMIRHCPWCGERLNK